MFALIFGLSAFIFVGGNQIEISNNCPFTVWPGIQGNPDKGQPNDGGFELGAGQAQTVDVPGDWAGRFWGRTGCDDSGRCTTGDCGNIACNGAGGNPPVTLAEITFAGAGGLDYYDVSLVDGYNLPIRMEPSSAFQTGDGGQYDCGAAGCTADLNAICPDELKVESDGATVACKSACEAFDTDQYCCRGDNGTPDTCKSEDWPVNYAAVFKQACPDAYSYAYDDTTSTFTCRGDPAANYKITFCP
ncbi:Thaumatin family [Nesidiocoris tenuis]|uniref:Thaumatin family n=1 Tax=Nesidiocoris tenuis TaxID=355587 RepID=A0ABN7AZY5_9HEMI|nr:Thaumatin family [Nesidiocoris tenuis]